MEKDDLYGMELKRGTKLLLKFVKMMLLSSYNDAAIAVSESIGGKKFCFPDE
jgi:D-alanyl-D-alanine carboxypeptidase